MFDNLHLVIQATAKLHQWLPPGEGGTLRPDRNLCFDISVSDANCKRALGLADKLLRVCEAESLGITYDATSYEHGVSIVIDGELVPIRLVERGRRVTHLAFEIGRNPTLGVWKDTASRPLEQKVSKIIAASRKIATNRTVWRKREEAFERKQKAVEYERAELRDQVNQEREAHKALLNDANNWQRAQLVRAYLAAAERAAVQDGTLDRDAAWFSWAAEQADRLDPLRPSPPLVLDIPYDDYRELGPYEILCEDGSIERIWG
ncbi:hypothetical protein PQ455_03330 [Sphingomonas naphthae]|uniref:Uncharacterized protein n=1 Tax=Sphingomonas naphthae TaxID=1813468 RepID=A0ABY7TR01_9SPHN|nr:hypothetical protein [Sphingomonas naphthae]WCT74274.1 hypothetical protein PQ455_03330 [Sphingomonas naphthae]